MIKRLVNIILFSFLTLLASDVRAQDYLKLHYTVSDGLPSNNVYYVYRDSKGFIWICTNKGIVRYNGIKFEVFTTVNGMPDNDIFSVQEDAYGRLWLATYNGELCYFQNNRFYNARNTPFLKKPFESTLISKIITESDSSVTMLFENTTRKVNITKSRLREVYLEDDPDAANFIFVRKLSGNKYKFIYRNCTKIVDSNHRELSRSPFNCSYNGVQCMDLDVSVAQDQRYIFNKHFVYDRDLNLIANATDKLGNTNTKSIYFDSKKSIFRSTGNGLFINDSIHVLQGNNVSSITQDIHNNFWIPTINDGVFVMNLDNLSSVQYRGIYKGVIRYAYADEGHLFYNTSDNNFYDLHDNKPQTIFDYSPYRKAEYGNNHGYLVLKDSVTNHYDYINFYNNYIFYLRDIAGTPKIDAGDRPFSDPEIVKQIAASKDQVYIRTIRRIFSIKRRHFADPSSLNVKNILLAHNTDRIRAFAKSPQGDIWFSSTYGVYKIVDEQDSLQSQFRNVTFNRFEFFGKYLVGYTLVGNVLVVCSNIDGNVKIDTIRQNATWDMFYPIDSTHMLISTFDLYRLFTINPPGSKQPYTITTIENPFVPIRCETVCADKKYCYFFAESNISKLALEELYVKALAPKLFFSTLKYGGRSFQMNNRLTVPYNSAKNISISLTALSFSGRNVYYLYSVVKKGTENWVQLQGENIDFIIPDPGTYTIKVKAKSMSSEYSEPIVFVLEILPPFYRTWWFNTFCILIATTLVVIGVRYRILWVIRKTEKENETRIRFMKSEYKALNALMNPHFIFNTLNNVQSLVNRNDKLAANEYLRIFADLVRQNMHNVSKESIPLQKEIDLVDNYLALEKLRFKELMNYDIEVDDDVDTSLIVVPPLIIQPLVENSIKHGILPRQSVDSRIIVKVYEVGDVLHIDVLDNGVGLSAAKKKANAKHESFGLKNIEHRVEQLGIILGKKVTFAIDEIVEDGQPWTVASITMEL